MSGSNTLELPRESLGVNHHAERRSRIAGMDTVALTIVHDLRNPLSVIHAAAEMLMNTDLSKLQMQRLVRNMYLASTRSQELLQHFAESCRLESSRRKPCNLSDLIAAAIARVSLAATAQSVRIEQLVPLDLIVIAERPGIESVLDNLLNNAVQALMGGGMIRASAARKEGAAVVEVRDTGPGVPPEVQQRLFQPFVSGGKKNGLGLGLAAAHQTVTEHGGRMWLYSEPGWGACFAFSLPIERTRSGS
jgi:signal transduction histidine kinase